MNIRPTEIPDVKLITPKRFGDDRGYFLESFSEKILAPEGVAEDWIQDNHSFTARAGTLRGLHYQYPDATQAKLVRVIGGAVMDVAVDVRKGSPTYGAWVGHVLSDDNHTQMYVPAGFLHGFATLTDNVHFLYKCSKYYEPAKEASVYFADPDLGIDWGIDPVVDYLSDKDKEDKAMAFADFDSKFDYKA